MSENKEPETVHALTPKDPEYYYPNRYRRVRPFVKNCINAFGNQPLIPTMTDHQHMVDYFLRDIYQPEILKRPFEQRPATMHKAMDEMHCLGRYLQFRKSGRNIFHFTPTLCEMLRKTDADDVPLGTVRFPYPFFFVSFGMQKELDLGEGFYVDGAYVHSWLSPADGEHTLELHVTTVRTDFDYRAGLGWLDTPNKYYYLPLHFNAETTVKEACATALREELEDTHRERKSMAGVHEVDGRRVTVIDRQMKTQEERRSHINEGYDAFGEAVKLVINGICYLTSSGGDVVTRYTEGAPEELLQKVREGGTPKQRRKAASQLEMIGYTQIHICGEKIEREYESEVTGIEVRTHWRRGHWRNQACGKGFSERRLLWVRPTIVRPDKGEPETGHVYDVEDDEREE